MLGRAALTEATLHDRLVSRGYQPKTAARAVTRCRELGYVSDERLALDRARVLRRRGSGSLKITDDLRGRGLAEDLVTAAVEASREGESEVAWARRALEGAGDLCGVRAWRLLTARGFAEEIVEDLLGERG
jgi:SOS response regulatory protein OraA/RecX